MDYLVKFVLLCAIVVNSLAFPSDLFKNSAWVIQSKHERITRAADKAIDLIEYNGTPKIYEMRIDSNVSNRYAQTLVTSNVRNYGNESSEAVFAVVLPQKAFISKFVMEIDGKNYQAYVKEKEEAKQIYEQAISRGQSAAHVAASARDSNRFTVSVNMEPESKASFLLTYEQLLERMDNQYELVINIHPGQPVKDLQVNVMINESLPLKFVRAPPIRSGNEIFQSANDLDPRAVVNVVNTTSAEVHFNPTIERQKELAKMLKEKEENGLSGQFIVQYDVVRSRNGGEVLLDEGYFVHFLAPSDMEPLPKYICFVLDTSGSMYGSRLAQLKVAMKKIFTDLKPSDKFHIINFSSAVSIPRLFPTEDPPEMVNLTSYDVNEDNIKRAIEVVDSFIASGSTNIAGALEYAMRLANKEKEDNEVRQPMVVFLTDGQANIGPTTHQGITAKVSEVNIHKVPIFSLSFGAGADRSLLEKISLANNGFARHIYEAADASLQLQDFYRYISSPIMSEVTFKYVAEANNLTRTSFPILFAGSELVVAGVLDQDVTPGLEVIGRCLEGPVRLVPEVKRSTSRLERMWAYLTIQQLLEDKEALKTQPDVREKALNLALKYSFVTSVSSLVVVKPNATSDVEPTDSNSVTQKTYTSSFSYSNFPARSYSSQYLSSSRRSRARGRNSISVRRYNHITPLIWTTERPSIMDNLMSKLPWLKNVLANMVIQTDKGSYPLGLNETATPNIACLETPQNTTGVCSLLHECPQVFPQLTDLQTFQTYQCDMRGFAAICCPMNSKSLVV